MGPSPRDRPHRGRRLARGAAALALIVGLATWSAVNAAEDPPLPTLAIDPASVTVSGVSSGAYLAHYLHVIHSETINGAGLIAGGPYDCPDGAYPWNLYRIFAVCMDLDDLLPFGGPPDPGRGIALARDHAAAGAIDATPNLADDPVMHISGNADPTVPTSVVKAAATFYEAFIPAERVDLSIVEGAGHGMPALNAVNTCGASASPFINDCDFDSAGVILTHLYGNLTPPGEAADAAAGTLGAFDQTAFLIDAGREHGIGDRGYLYVPETCADGAACRLHVALHGCQQTLADIGETFVREAGYNRWADANGIVILYPQATAVTRRFLGIPIPWPNPRGCWDWWGFTGDDYAVRAGVQPRVIKAMIDRITASPPQ